ncbi:MAG: hypothetical protein ACREUE_14040, partial [Panacagrimonas sp.]
MVRIQKNHDIVVFDRLPTFVTFGQAASRQMGAEAMCERLVPFDVGHLATVGVQPDDVGTVGIEARAAAKERATAKQRMAIAQG